MLIGAAASISGFTAILATAVGTGLGYFIYYICRSLEIEISNGGDNEANGKSLMALDELKMLTDSLYTVNNQKKETENDVYYFVNVPPKEKLDKLETVYNYVKSED